MTEREPAPPSEVLAFYDHTSEESRLESGPFRLEFERTKEILARALPPPPARILNVGGAAGAYSLWLAARGYQTHLVDASDRLVAEARSRSAKAAHPIESLAVADARKLPQPDGFADVVLLMGPLYHLTEPGDRIRALKEAHRVLVAGGTIVVAVISRFASALDGLVRRLTLDPRFVAIRDRDLADGQHRNDTGTPEYFTTAYFHRPDDLRAELEGAGFGNVEIRGVEGPAWMLPDFDARWDDPALKKDMLYVARALESEPSMLGVSAHLLGIGRKR